MSKNIAATETRSNLGGFYMHRGVPNNEIAYRSKQKLAQYESVRTKVINTHAKLNANFDIKKRQ